MPRALFPAPSVPAPFKAYLRVGHVLRYARIPVPESVSLPDTDIRMPILEVPQPRDARNDAESSRPSHYCRWDGV